MRLGPLQDPRVSEPVCLSLCVWACSGVTRKCKPMPATPTTLDSKIPPAKFLSNATCLDLSQETSSRTSLRSSTGSSDNLVGIPSNVSANSIFVEDGDPCEQPYPHWHFHRVRLRALFVSKLFETGLCLIILLSAVLMIIETDAHAGRRVPPAWVPFMNDRLLFVFCFEIGLRLYTFRRKFFHSLRNLVDVSVVSADVASAVYESSATNLPPVSILRLLRLVRLLRAVRVLRAIPQAHLMITGMVTSAKATICGSVALAVIIFPCSVIAVWVIQPVNERVAESGLYEDSGCERCPRAFASVADASLTIFQTVIAGDSWGALAIPVLEEAPWSIWFFLPVFMWISLGVLNLITATIVDSALAETKESEKLQLAAKEAELVRNMRRFYHLCRMMDTDESGSLSLPEFELGFETCDEFRHILQAMDINKEDIHVVFSILDEDRSGDVDYKEFAQQLHRLKTDDSHTLLFFIRHYVAEISRNVSQELLLLRSGLVNEIHSAVGATEALTHSQSAGADSLSSVPPDTAALNQLARSIEAELSEMRRSNDDLVQAMCIQSPAIAETRHDIPPLCTEDGDLSCASVDALLPDDLGVPGVTTANPRSLRDIGRVEDSSRLAVVDVTLHI